MDSWRGVRRWIRTPSCSLPVVAFTGSDDPLASRGFFSLACLVFSVRPPVSHLATHFTPPPFPSRTSDTTTLVLAGPALFVHIGLATKPPLFFSYSRLGFDNNFPTRSTKRLAPPCVSFSASSSDNGANVRLGFTNRLPEHGFGS